ncbi:MAG TPA: Crp/Fnr family transcriptional regulator [Albitalea sp.]|nr:Crp/Fnr family transcriptional regulator [Albitalea sp.]
MGQAERMNDHGSMGDLLQLMGASAGAADGLADVPVGTRHPGAGDALFHEDDCAQAIYFVRAGMFKTLRTADDGHEQVLGFAGRGAMLGFDAMCLPRHPTAAVALEPSSVYVVARQDVFGLGERIPAFARVLHLASSHELTRRAEHADLLAPVAPEVRLARFLVHLARRKAADGEPQRQLHLPMSRRDIASHLGVAHETVSRAFTSLSGSGHLRVGNREVEILDLDALQACSLRTRRLAQA